MVELCLHLNASITKPHGVRWKRFLLIIGHRDFLGGVTTNAATVLTMFFDHIFHFSIHIRLHGSETFKPRVSVGKERRCAHIYLSSLLLSFLVQ